jgi:hypothetical protein
MLRGERRRERKKRGEHRKRKEIIKKDTLEP